MCWGTGSSYSVRRWPELEERWAGLCEVRHAIGVSSGTAGLLLTLQALGVGAGDEVITPPNSFLASTSTIILAGATPRFADVGEDFNVDPGAIRAAITPRTRAIIAVHLAGRPADMDAINAIAREREITVIEDAAQAFGATYGTRPIGSLGRAACFSLHPLKTVSACGDGGLVTTNDDALAARLRLARNHGLTHRQEDCTVWGHNARLDTLQAAMALVKLRRREAMDVAPAGGGGHLPAAAGGHHQGCRPDRPDDTCVYQTFPIETDHRDALVDHLQASGIGCAVHYRTPIHLLAVARDLGYRAGDFPVAERQAKRVLSLPIHEGLTDAQVHHVCDVIRE